MPLSSTIKDCLNRGLARGNLHLGTLTAEKAEVARLLKLSAAGQFTEPVLPVLPQFSAWDGQFVLEAVLKFKDETNRFSTRSEERYSYFNDYFSSPDAEVAYALVRELKPKRIIEVGSGNSTRLFREAIQDGGLEAELISIDPVPRRSIESVASQVIKSSIEEIEGGRIACSLAENDILFIDSSHEVRIGNDVLHLVFNVLPKVKSGVLIHFHDIFLPYDYPREWIIDRRWSQFQEQYLVQALLQDSLVYEVLWPGHYAQRTLPNFADYFAGYCGRFGSSLWMRKLS